MSQIFISYDTIDDEIAIDLAHLISKLSAGICKGFVAGNDLNFPRIPQTQKWRKAIRKAVKESQIVHFHNYPRSPKMNAYIERYNRTVQEGFVDWNLDLLFTDIEVFNLKLVNWLIWYNTKRPHQSLKNQAPLQYYVSNFLSLTEINSHKWWTCT